MKKSQLNMKFLSRSLYVSLLVSCIYECMCLHFFCLRIGGHLILYDIATDFIFLFLCGYGEVLIIYIVLISLIKHISHLLLKRIIKCILWIICFSCIESFFVVCLRNLERPKGIENEIMLIPPLLIKMLFFIYYKYKGKYDYKKMQIENERTDLK